MYYRDILNEINPKLKRPEIILLFGARETGKSTLPELLSEKHRDLKILNCEQPVVYDAFHEINIPK
ncbi:hypothetical protein MNBD_BACTEROID07-17 [hydrothermal vent metagenome]|uniref:AAA domain-containing protein n=1 Tax=hydrothermal vent metagenome TaxID=652676 RepID=A0A3B0UWF7_9ZZZZ